MDSRSGISSWVFSDARVAACFVGVAENGKPSKFFPCCKGNRIPNDLMAEQNLNYSGSEILRAVEKSKMKNKNIKGRPRVDGSCIGKDKEIVDGDFDVVDDARCVVKRWADCNDERTTV